jgi:ABC-type transport system involved in cytochrome bd biosynthesis fused ATPase/permease subunit
MENFMIWFLLFVFVFALLMGILQVPIWIMYVVLILMVIFILLRNPLLFGKDADKIMEHLKKSKAPYMKFLYHFLQGELLEAEHAAGKIRSKKTRLYSEIMLLMERKQYDKAKELLAQMGGHKTKWYALADIAINEGNVEAFKQNKERITDTFFLHMLEIDKAVYEGKKEEAVKMLENIIPTLRGYKLLTVVQYRKQILNGRI